jgi:NADH-quinone oxidoreductase subunit K
MIILDQIIINFLIFFIALISAIINFNNIIKALIAIEIMLLSSNLTLIFFSIYLDDMLGQIFAISTLTIAASESAIGLALLISIYKIKGNLLIHDIPLIKG